MSLLGSLFGNGSPFGESDYVQQHADLQRALQQFINVQQQTLKEKSYRKFNINEEDIVDAEFYVVDQKALPEPTNEMD